MYNCVCNFINKQGEKSLFCDSCFLQRILQGRFHKCIEKNTWRCIGGGYILHLSGKKLFAYELSEYFFLCVWKQCSNSETWLNKEFMWILLALKNDWSTASLLNECLFLVAVTQQTRFSGHFSPHCFKFSCSSASFAMKTKSVIILKCQSWLILVWVCPSRNILICMTSYTF